MNKLKTDGLIHLMYTPSEIESLRQKCMGSLGESFANLKAFVDKTIDAKDVVSLYPKNEQGKKELYVDPGFLSAFVYFVTKEKRYSNFARSVINYLLGAEKWTIPEMTEDGRKVDLISASKIQVVVFYLDWCRDCISDDEFDQIVSCLEGHGARAVLSDHQKQVGWYNEKGPINNWVSVINSNPGLAGVLLWKDSAIFREALLICIHHVKRYLDWIEEDGSLEEAGGYWVYGIENALMFLEALRINKDSLPPEVVETGACDWLHTMPKLHRTGRFPISGFMGNEFIMVFGDCSRKNLNMYRRPLSMLAKTYQDSELKYYSEKGELFRPMCFIWDDPGLKSTLPESSSKPLAWNMDLGWVVIRDDPSDDKGMFFAMRGGSNSQTHCHFDLGSFILWNNGQPLIHELGKHCDYPPGFFENRDKFYHSNSQGHNSILVGGRGQLEAGTNAAVRDFKETDAGGASFTLAINSPHNEIKSHLRHVKVDLKDKRVVVRDEIELNAPNSVKVLFHHDGVVDSDDRAIVIQKPNSTAEILFSSEEMISVNQIAHDLMDYVEVSSTEDVATFNLTTSIHCKSN